MRLTLPLLASLAILGGCAAPINVRNAEAHAQAGYAAERAGDWDGARRQFAQAVVNADLGNADVHGKAIVNYEYGRALGVTCEYAMSEKYLLRSKELVVQEGRAPYLPLYELGLLAEQQRKPQEAAQYFAELIPLMEQQGLLEHYPLGVADVHERYASALASLGKSVQASAQRAQASAIREANPNAKPFGSVTPYGSACSKPVS